MRGFSVARASGQRGDDDIEWVGSLEPRGVDGGSHVGLGLSSPHCAVAVGHLSLDDTWPQLSLRTVVGGVHLSGIVAEGQQLVSRPSGFGLKLPSGEIVLDQQIDIAA